MPWDEHVTQTSAGCSFSNKSAATKSCSRRCQRQRLRYKGPVHQRRQETPTLDWLKNPAENETHKMVATILSATTRNPCARKACACARERFSSPFRSMTQNPCHSKFQVSFATESEHIVSQSDDSKGNRMWWVALPTLLVRVVTVLMFQYSTHGQRGKQRTLTNRCTQTDAMPDH